VIKDRTRDTHRDRVPEILAGGKGRAVAAGAARERAEVLEDVKSRSTAR